MYKDDLKIYSRVHNKAVIPNCELRTPNKNKILTALMETEREESCEDN